MSFLCFLMDKSFTMDEPRFRWGAVIEEEVKSLNLKVLNRLICSLPAYVSSDGRTRREAFNFIALQDENTQHHITEKAQEMLRNPTSDMCKRSWMLKRKFEVEEEELRRVKSRLDGINNGLQNHGKILCWDRDLDVYRLHFSTLLYDLYAWTSE